MTILLASTLASEAQTTRRQTQVVRAGSAALQAISRANRGVVGIISGQIDSTSLRMTSDLQQVLDSKDQLRVVPMIGKGSVQGIRDILYLRGTDIGLVQSDVLNYFKRAGRFPGIEARIHYIAKLHNEEVHVLARTRYTRIDDLRGKSVNFGPEGSGSAMTAQIMFDAHGVKVKPVNLTQAAALEELKRGAIAATVVVGGKPAPIFEPIKRTDHVHFLDVEYLAPLKDGYAPGIMVHDDYPNLISRNETVRTITVGAVLAVYNWMFDSARYRKLATFTNSFFNHFEEFKEEPRHAKWREVRLAEPVPGWTRFRAAEDWLRRNAPRVAATTPPAKTGLQANADAKGVFGQFLESRAGAQAQGLSRAEKDALLDQFVRWMKSQQQ